MAEVPREIGNANAGILLAELQDQLERTIGRAVIDVDELHFSGDPVGGA